MQKNAHTRGVIATIAALAITASDLAIKIWALKNLPSANNKLADGIFSFVLHKNQGIAFNIPMPQSILLIISCVLIVVLVYLFFKTRLENQLFAYGSLITAIGAIGNLADRALHGFTTDYILLFTRSAINLSDTVIISGVLFIIFAHKIKIQTKNPQSAVDKT